MHVNFAYAMQARQAKIKQTMAKPLGSIIFHLKYIYIYGKPVIHIRMTDNLYK